MVITIALAWSTGSTLAAEQTQAPLPAFPPLIVDSMTFDEPYDAGWQLYFDNDLFAGNDTDRDYTGGFALAYSGRRAREWRFSTDAWLDKFDELIGIQELQFSNNGFLRHTMEFGLILFTPEDISSDAPLPMDHPFGNFLFLANSQQVTFPESNWILQSSLTLGILGTEAGPEFQSLIHSATGSDAPRGWDNQISNGGELAGKYTVIALKNLAKKTGSISYEVSSAVEGNIGLNTDISVSMTTRFGKLRSPWWSFVPHQSDYIHLGQTITSRIDERIMPAEFFGWAGLKTKVTAYNGFLQGMFRDSAVKFDHDELEHFVLEGWLGVTKTWNSGFGLSFFVRKRTGEIKGPLRRDPLWSGFIVSFTS